MPEQSIITQFFNPLVEKQPLREVDVNQTPIFPWKKNTSFSAEEKEVISDLKQIIQTNFDLHEVQEASEPVLFSTELWDKFPTSESEYQGLIKVTKKKRRNECGFCGLKQHPGSDPNRGVNSRTCPLKKWKEEIDP